MLGLVAPRCLVVLRPGDALAVERAREDEASEDTPTLEAGRLLLRDRTLSRHHCTVIMGEKALTIVDSSKRGVYVKYQGKVE